MNGRSAIVTEPTLIVPTLTVDSMLISDALTVNAINVSPASAPTWAIVVGALILVFCAVVTVAHYTDHARLEREHKDRTLTEAIAHRHHEYNAVDRASARRKRKLRD